MDESRDIDRIKLRLKKFDVQFKSMFDIVDFLLRENELLHKLLPSVMLNSSPADTKTLKLEWEESRRARNIAMIRFRKELTENHERFRRLFEELGPEEGEDIT